MLLLTQSYWEQKKKKKEEFQKDLTEQYLSSKLVGD